MPPFDDPLVIAGQGTVGLEIVDDLLATGGTAKATCELVENLGGTVQALSFVVELNFLPGREKLEGYDVHSLVSYDS